ncbi:MAG: MFS transporter [Deltaproteobacteria bacterium]|nr:MFS transporter [Deltaproteobacteria bacterium]
MENPYENPAGKSPRTPWGQVLLFVGAGVAVSFQVGKAPPVLPAIRAELDMSLFLAGWILSTFNVIGLVLGSFSGAVADAFGHRRLLIRGLLLQAAGSLLGSFSPGVTLLFITRVLEGLGFIMIAVSAPALIARATRPRDLRMALSLWSCWLPTGAAVMMLLTPLITPLWGWRGLWQINAGLLALYALCLARRTSNPIPEPGQGRPKLARVWRDMRAISTSAGPLLLAVIFSTYTLQWLAVMGFFPTLLIENFGLGSGTASILTALMVAINIPGNLAGGWLLHRGLRRWKLIALASLVMGLSSLGIYSTEIPLVLRFAACLVFSCVGGILPASVLSGAPAHAPAPQMVATTNGLIMQGSQLGQMIGPPALALIVSGPGGWQAAPWLLILAAAIGIGLSLALAVLEKRRGIDP